MKGVRYFEVHPELGKRFYRVMIFRHKKDMIIYERESAKQRRDHTRRYGFQALTQNWKSITKGRVDLCIGQIIFHEKFFGSGVVAHELTHAATFYLASDKRFSFRMVGEQTSGGWTTRHDERLARCVGNLNLEFWNRYYGRKVRYRRKKR